MPASKLYEGQAGGGGLGAAEADDMRGMRRRQLRYVCIQTLFAYFIALLFDKSWRIYNNNIELILNWNNIAVGRWSQSLVIY